MSFLQWLTDALQTQTPPAVVTDEAKLSAAKAVGQIAFICKSYGMRVVDGCIDDLNSDLATMLANADLDSVRLELLGTNNKVLFEFKVTFSSGTSAGRSVDSAKGVEIPLLDRRLVKDRRLIVMRNGRESLYKDRLKMSWGPATTLKKAAGSAYASEHAASITGGRQAAAFHVSNAARHQLVATQTGTRGFFFAKDLDLDREGVFVLAKHLPPAFEVRVGARFTALVIATPRGLQARSIKAV
jgi:hypothetical protein